MLTKFTQSPKIKMLITKTSRTSTAEREARRKTKRVNDDDDDDDDDDDHDDDYHYYSFPQTVCGANSAIEKLLPITF